MPPSATDASTAAATYVYGVVRAASARAGQKGLLGAEVRLLVFGEVAALTSPVPPGEVRAKRRDVMTHSQVLQHALSGGPVLPMRFGTVFDTEEDVVAELLERRQVELARLLRELDGQVELNVRATYDEERLLAEIVQANPRIARLRAATRELPAPAARNLRLELGETVAAELAARRNRDATLVVDRLGLLANRVHVDDPWTEYEVLRASFLVEVAMAEKFDGALECLAREHADVVRFKCVGPLPPHSFVSLARD